MRMVGAEHGVTSGPRPLLRVGARPRGREQRHDLPLGPGQERARAAGVLDDLRAGVALSCGRRSPSANPRTPNSLVWVGPETAKGPRATLCYMRTVTHREMRNSSGEILRAVAAGETVSVTNNGQVAALISPPGGDTLARLAAQGQVRMARRPAADLSTIRRKTAQRTTAQMISDTRGDW